MERKCHQQGAMKTITKLTVQRSDKWPASLLKKLNERKNKIAANEEPCNIRQQHLTHRFISADATYGHNAATKCLAFYCDCSVLSRACVMIMT